MTVSDEEPVDLAELASYYLAQAVATDRLISSLSPTERAAGVHLELTRQRTLWVQLADELRERVAQS